MENAIQKQEPETEIQVIDQTITQIRKPEEILSDAKEAAKALQRVISGKRKPVVFNGEQYLEFEDWQTVGRFYGLAAKVTNSRFIEFGDVKGWESHAVVINTNTGLEISAADAMCLSDEPNWSRKPLFQLRSMAQTRACAKSLRNVLAWVVVLAGYKPTPAEEMQGVLEAPKSVYEKMKSEEMTVEPVPQAKPKGETKPQNISAEKLGEYVMPTGKYQGIRLKDILQKETATGKKQGLEYLIWVSENFNSPEIKSTVSRYLEVMELA